MAQPRAIRTRWQDCGEYWDAEYMVDGQRTPFTVHKSVCDDKRYKFGSPDFWDYIERSAISSHESWRDHPEWRIN